MLRLDLNINADHNLAFIYNYFDGAQLNASDNDPDEFEFANHFYTKGAEAETYTLKLTSQWTDVFSTEFFISHNTMDDSQITIGDPTMGDQGLLHSRPGLLSEACAAR